MKKKMGRGVLFAVIVAAAVLAAAAGGAAWYMHALRSGNDFLTGTRINGTSVSGKTPRRRLSCSGTNLKAGRSC